MHNFADYFPLAILLFLVYTCQCIPVDNGVEGDPEIECGSAAITVNFNTQKPFEGHVYVKGLYSEAGCRNDESGRQVAGITLPFDTCNVARTRSLNPKGIFVSTTVVISFHVISYCNLQPYFLTKVDRAYRVQCFYMEADKTVSADVAVSDLTTAFHSHSVPMPICRYEILSNGPGGQPVTFAEIGEQVYHKWTCDSETTDTFCMVVHTCFVDDGNGDLVNIINAEGCALDRYILNNLEYPTDLTAGQEAHVYKYADRSQLFYQCQITITIKEPNSDCPRPQCPEPTGRGAGNAVRSGASQFGGTVSSAGVGSSGTAAAVFEATELTENAEMNESDPRSSAASQKWKSKQKRFARNADWRNNAAGTLDVRTELNTLDIMEQVW
ncbi:unnamed protein product [Enterobius vermicularis]|uniref:ZP domain-containing protein n=1 Tax=Enterobius vermicularis TaxID=51028 RepID=A0A0N4V3G6_ENTVE|nr:unnamed protein product [Enterobius vermicularis]